MPKTHSENYEIIPPKNWIELCNYNVTLPISRLMINLLIIADKKVQYLTKNR